MPGDWKKRPFSFRRHRYDSNCLMRHLLFCVKYFLMWQLLRFLIGPQYYATKKEDY